MKTSALPTNEDGLSHLMKTFASLTNEAKSPSFLISTEGASSLAKRLHFFISPARGDFIEKGAV